MAKDMTRLKILLSEIEVKLLCGVLFVCLFAACVSGGPLDWPH